MKYTNLTINSIYKKHDEIFIKRIYKSAVDVIKSSVRIFLIGSLIFTATANAIREYKEEKMGDNPIIDVTLGFGSVVLKNKDTRSAIKIYNNMIQAAVNFEGLETFYKNYNSKKIFEKKEFITSFIKTVAAAGGVRVDEVEFEENTDYYGAYKGYHIGGISFSENIIYINNRLLRDPEFSNFLKSAFHETVHIVENMNIETNPNIHNYDFVIYNSNYSYGDRVYNTKVPEVVAKLIAAKFNTILQEKIYSRNINTDTKPNVINEVLNTILEEAVENDKILTSRSQEYYNQLSVNEIIHIFMFNHYNSKNKNFDANKLEQSYLYDILKFVLEPKTFNQNYKDFSNVYNDIKQLSLIEEENTF